MFHVNLEVMIIVVTFYGGGYWIWCATDGFGNGRKM